ncbi:MAG: hypothetical protein MUF54_03710 [Polyangiaceae bacterium]|nr:hypothetical protein [Polyangiaceae bacterium]
MVVSSVTPARVAGFRKVVGLRHPHLASVVDLLDDVPPSQIATGGAAPERACSVAVAEHVAGQTLHERLEAGTVPIRKAVLWTARIASALHALHAKGGVHGALSPRSVIVARADGGVVPVLTNLRAPANGAFCSPERVRGAGPTAEDDTWALHATLFAALAGTAPFSGKSREQLAAQILQGRLPDLASHGIADAMLQGIVQNGFCGDLRARVSSIPALEHGLTEWLRAQPAGELDVSSAPPQPGGMSLAPAPIDDEDVAEAHRLALEARRKASKANPHKAGDELETRTYSARALAPRHPAKRVQADQPAAACPVTPSTDVEEDEEDETQVMGVPMLLPMLPHDTGRLQHLPATDSAHPSASQPKPPDHDDQSNADGDIEGPLESVPPAEGADSFVADDVTVRKSLRSFAAQEPTVVNAHPSMFDDATVRRLPQAFLAGLTINRPPSDSISDDDTITHDPPNVSKAQHGLQSAAGASAVLRGGASPLPANGRASADAGSAPASSTFGLHAIAVASSGSVDTSRSPVIGEQGSTGELRRAPRTWATWVVSTIAMALGAVAAFFVAVRIVDDGEPASASATPSSAPVPTPSASLASPATVDATIEEASQGDGAWSGDKPASNLRACVESYFPRASFRRPMDFEHVCKNTNARKIALMLHSQLVRGGAGGLTEGMKLWSALGWYELAVVSVVRDGCCGSVEPFELPQQQAACVPVAEALRLVTLGGCGEQEAHRRAVEYGDAVRCLYERNQLHPYRYHGFVQARHQAAFVRFLRQLPPERCGK